MPICAEQTCRRQSSTKRSSLERTCPEENFVEQTSANTWKPKNLDRGASRSRMTMLPSSAGGSPDRFSLPIHQPGWSVLMGAQEVRKEEPPAHPGETTLKES